MNRGEVWMVNFDRSVGGEIRKKRPAVIVSNAAANRHLSRVQVVPLTTETDRAPLLLQDSCLSGSHTKSCGAILRRRT